MASVAIAVGVSILASVLTSALAPQPGVSNQLDDLSVLKSEYGVSIPVVLGEHRVTGNVIWARDLYYTEKKVRGKNNNIFKYYADYAVLLCEGEVQGITKLWLNNKLYFNLESSSPDVVQDANNKIAQGRVTLFNGSSSQLPSTLIESFEGVGNVPAFRNRAYVQFQRLKLNEYGNIVPKVEAKIVERTTPLHLSDIIEKLCSLANISPSDYSIDLTVDPVIKGYKIERSGDSIRKSLEDLQTVFFFQIVDDGNRLLFRDQLQPVRGDLPVIDSFQTTTRLFGSGVEPAFIETIDKKEDLPSEIQLEYPNANNDFNRGIQAQYRSNATHVNEVNFKTSAVITDSEAQTAMTRMIDLYWSQQKKFESLKLNYNYFGLIAGDTVRLEVRNTLRECQVQKVTRGTNFIVEVDLFASSGDLTLIDNPSDVNNEYNPPEDIIIVGDPEAVVIDAPLVNDGDFEYGYYATGRQANPDTLWQTGSLIVSVNDADFDEVGELLATATHGTLTAATGINRAGSIITGTSKLQVAIPYGTLNSATPLQFENFDYVLYVGGELIAYETATLTGTNVNGDLLYDISNYVRGIRGTEHAIADHTIGTPVYMLRGNNEFIDFEGVQGDINSKLEFKAIPDVADDDDEVTSITTINPFQGTRLKPYAPTNVKVAKNTTNNDLTITWQRRTRRNGDWTDFTETVLLEESTEAYVLRIYNSAGTVLLRTVNLSNQTIYVYTSANQVADFGSNQNGMRITISQVSSVVGEGFVYNSNGVLLFSETYS